MPRWLKWFLGLFIGLNLLAMVAGLPNPFTLIYDAIAHPQPRRTLDGGLQALSVFVGIVMLILWAILAAVMYKLMRPRKPAQDSPAGQQLARD